MPDCKKFKLCFFSIALSTLAVICVLNEDFNDETIKLLKFSEKENIAYPPQKRATRTIEIDATRLSVNRLNKMEGMPENFNLWIASAREEWTSSGEMNCLGFDGKVSNDNLRSIGVDPAHIAPVAERLEGLLDGLSSIIEKHFQIECEEKETYRISAYRAEAVPLFEDTFRDLYYLIGPSVTKNVISSFPLEKFAGHTGAFDVVFSVSNEGPDGNVDAGVIWMNYVVYNEDETPRSFGFIRSGAIERMFLGVVKVKDSCN